MHPDSKNLRPIWWDQAKQCVAVIDQRQLPHEFVVAELNTVDDVIAAIGDMYVRGAPLIGVTGAWGVFLAVANAPKESPSNAKLIRECERLKAARPTAINLAWAVDRVAAAVTNADPCAQRTAIARHEASLITEEESRNCRQIGRHGLALIESISLRKQGRAVNILTHCNAGWLACIDYGTATAPIYAAAEKGIRLHVWVDETRPLNQGARLTAWELGRAGIDHTVITDNAGGHLMQHDLVDMVIVGTDRTTRSGDVANKVGTYLKALAARDNHIPFYVALPSSTFDWDITDGLEQIPIETRDPDEIRYVQGWDGNRCRRVLVPPADSPASNVAFDVTPARLVSAFITERGVCEATPEGIRRLFADKTPPAETYPPLPQGRTRIPNNPG